MKQFIKSFFYSKDKPSPLYFWASVFLLLTALYIGTEVVKCIIGLSVFSFVLCVQLMGLILALIGIYNLKVNADANRASVTEDKQIDNNKDEQKGQPKV